MDPFLASGAVREPAPAHARIVRWLLRCSIAMMLLTCAAQAQAAFGTCSTPQYLQRFDERLSGYDCVVYRQHRVGTPEGQRRLRIIHHRGADLDPALLVQSDRGLRAAIAALARVGRYAVYDVSILLVHDVMAPNPDILAYATGTTRTGAALHECQVALYASSVASSDAAAVVAHEIFHCVQAATFSPGQNKTYRENRAGAWWIEGSADWFASLALPDPFVHQQRANEFADTIQTKPLYRHDYASVVFFLWLAQHEGPRRILPFLAGMPQDPANSAQRQAIRDAISDAQWMRFATDLADDRIRRPHGPPIRTGLALRTQWPWDRDRTDQLPLQPYAIATAVAQVDCGTWETQVTPAQLYASRARGTREWGPLPRRIDTEHDPAEYTHIATNTGDTQANHRFGVRRLAGCANCGGITTTDACLVGTWRQTAGGALQWLRENMPAGVNFRGEVDTPTLTLQSDGMYITGVASASMSIQSRHSRTRGEGNSQMQASGRWSAGDGRMHLCADLQSLTGEVRLITPRQTVRGALPPVPPAATTMTYTCSGDTLQTTQRMPRPDSGELAPMHTTYSRVR